MRGIRSPCSREKESAYLTETGISHCSVLKLRSGLHGDSITSYLASKGIKLGKTIGEGSYCKVRIAYRVSELGPKKLACKVVNKKKASKDFVVKFLPREISIVRNIKHPNIVTVFQIIDLDDQVFMFMDYCERGDLLDHIRNRGAFSESKAKHFFRQLVSAMEYLHGRDIAHRDLKCENVLLWNRDVVKIADFGFSRLCHDPKTNKRILSTTFCGSAAYAAPEILQGISYNPKMYDVWSMGCIVFIMLFAAMPFDDSNIQDMIKIQTSRRLSFPSNSTVSHRARRLIMHLLEPDITRRATITQVANSLWLRACSRTTL